MGNASIIHYILYILIVIVFYYPTFGYADQTHLTFKVIIPQSLSLSVSTLSQNNTRTDSPGFEYGHPSVLPNIDKVGNVYGADILENIGPTNYLSNVISLHNYELNQNLQRTPWIDGGIPFSEQNEFVGYKKTFFFPKSLINQSRIVYSPKSSKLLPPQNGSPLYILCSP